MSKYMKYNRRSMIPEKPWQIHPIWRGIGCVLMLLIPVMSYAGAALLVQENLKQRWVPVPALLYQSVAIPGLPVIPYLYANLAVAVLLSLIGFGVVMIAYALIYRLVGPPRYGPLDAPPDWHQGDTFRSKRRQ
jgi:predicted permease